MHYRDVRTGEDQIDLVGQCGAARNAVAKTPAEEFAKFAQNEFLGKRVSDLKAERYLAFFIRTRESFCGVDREIKDPLL